MDTPAGNPVLRADKDRGTIVLDRQTTLTGIPDSAWQYRLGSRSALEWVLDQYKERKPRDPTIRERFNTYRFADHKERVIDLLQRVHRKRRNGPHRRPTRRTLGGWHQPRARL